MADPGFVPGVIGFAVSELLSKLIVAANKVITLQTHCSKLSQLLQSLQPVVQELVDQEQQDRANISPPVRTFLQDFYRSLVDAQTVILKCADPEIRWNLVLRYRVACQLESATIQIKEHVQLMQLIDLAASTRHSAQINQHTDAMDAYLRNLASEIARLNLTLETQRLMTGEDLNRDRAFYAIKSGTDRVTESAFSGTRSMPTEPKTESSSELQPLPEFVFGMDDLVTQVEDMLTDSSSSSKWIGIWATGGAGKTLLVQTVVNSPTVQAHFSSNVCWLTVGRRPDIKRLQERFCKKAAHKSKTFDSEDDGKMQLFNLLQGRKCLLVLDDVWDAAHLEWFDVLTAAGSRVLLTTRNRPVLQRVHAMEVRVEMLSEEHSRKLFCVHAFQGEENLPSHLRDSMENVVAECKGLPLALKVIGGYLAMKTDINTWNFALQNLRNAAVINREHEVQLFHRLKLSYDDLTTIDSSRGHALQDFFLYFAAFPEDEDIQVEQLLEVWSGEEFVGRHEDIDAETEAYYLLGVLVGRSLVELEKGWSDSRSSHVFSCKIHDVLRDLALYILQNGKQVSEQQCLFKAGRQASSFPEAWQIPSLSARKISLIRNDIQSLPSTRIRAPSVRVLLLSDNKILAIHGKFLRNFPNLQVLDLSNTQIDSLPTMLGRLAELRVLSLRRSAIRSLPSSIAKLIKLERLNLQGCGRLASLPARALSKLVNLQYLNARGCANVWDEESAEAACCPMLGEAFGQEQLCSLEVLSSLLKLRKLWISSTSQEALPGTMGRLTSLRWLSVYFQKLKEFPPEFKSLAQLETLDLNSCFALRELAAWVPDCFCQLKTLDLRCCRSLVQLPALDKLKQLTKLDLCLCSSLQRLPDSFGCSEAFPALEELWLIDCRFEEFPQLHPGAFPRLSILNMVNCTSLKPLHHSFRLLSSLRQLNLGGCRLLDLNALPNDQIFAALVRLEELVLKNTSIHTIPCSVMSLPVLKKLNVSECQLLESVPDQDQGETADYFPSLQELLVSKASRLKSLPARLAQLPRLRLLDVTDCKEQVITDDLQGALAKRKDIQVKGSAMHTSSNF